MFHIADLKNYNLIDNGKIIGTVSYNPKFNFALETTRPFIRCKLRVLEKVGRVNYNMLDNYIVSSLNDYYNKMANIKDVSLRNKSITEYQQLYYLWQKVMTAKKENDPNTNSYYDDIVYRLYILGYRN